MKSSAYLLICRPPPVGIIFSAHFLWNYDYLCMCKLQYLNIIHCLMIKFHVQEINHQHFLNFLRWYEVQTYTEDRPGQMKFIGDIINLVTWCLLKSFSELKVTFCQPSSKSWGNLTISNFENPLLLKLESQFNSPLKNEHWTFVKTPH